MRFGSKRAPLFVEEFIVRFSLVVLFLLFMVLPVGGQTTSVWLKPEDQAQLEALRRSGLEALYNLDYDKAQKDFKEITQRFPNHPAGYQLQAAGVWAKTLYESRRLQGSLYSSESFYSTGDDKVDPKIVNEFRSLTREAKRLSEAKLKQDPKSVDALNFLAATEGLKASFEEAVERRHYAALKDGNDAVNSHREVLKLDPTYIDAQLTIGLYEYVVGSLPLPIKLIAGISGFRGSKKRGLTLLEQVARDGHWSKDDAKTLLMLLYTREKRYAEVIPITRELSQKYPRNYLYRLETADALVALAAQKRKANDPNAAALAEKEAFATFDELLRDRAVRDASARALDLIHFKYGEALSVAGLPERAAREFLATTKVDRAEPGLVTMAHLYAGRSYDTAGKREEALTQYKQVLTRPNVYDAHDEAKRGLQKAYKAEQVVRPEAAKNLQPSGQ